MSAERFSEDYQNPFDNNAHAFTVLVNPEQRYSLWPQIAPEPAGWTRVFGPASRDECVEYVESHWLEISPLGDTGGAR